MADNLQALSKLTEQMRKILRSPQFYFPPCFGQEAAEMFKDQNVHINVSDGSRYYHGALIEKPHVHLDVTRLNEKIATMNLPNYPHRLYPPGVLPPEERRVYLLGKWNLAEEGEDDVT